MLQALLGPSFAPVAWPCLLLFPHLRLFAQALFCSTACLDASFVRPVRFTSGSHHVTRLNCGHFRARYTLRTSWVCIIFSVCPCPQFSSDAYLRSLAFSVSLPCGRFPPPMFLSFGIFPFSAFSLIAASAHPLALALHTIPLGFLSLSAVPFPSSSFPSATLNCGLVRSVHLSLSRVLIVPLSRLLFSSCVTCALAGWPLSPASLFCLLFACAHDALVALPSPLLLL